MLSTPKSATLAVTAVIASVTLPVFVTVSVCGSPDVPTNWEAKETLVGLKESAALLLVPAEEIGCGLPGALSVIVSVALFLTGRCRGKNDRNYAGTVNGNGTPVRTGCAAPDDKVAGPSHRYRLNV